MNPTIEAITSQMGPHIAAEVKLKEEISALADKLHGAQHPEMIGAYHQQLHDKREELQRAKDALRHLRTQHIEALEARHKVLEMEIQESHDGFEIEELKGIQRAINIKIDNIKKLL
jgi:hypothetical protein